MDDVLEVIAATVDAATAVSFAAGAGQADGEPFAPVRSSCLLRQCCTTSNTIVVPGALGVSIVT